MLTKKSTQRYGYDYEYEYELRPKQKFYLYLYEVCPSIEIIDMLWKLYIQLNHEEVLKFYQSISPFQPHPSGNDCIFKTVCGYIDSDVFVQYYKERENIDGKRSQITQKILELPDFPLPQQAVEEESKAIFQSNIQRAAQQGAKQEDMESKKDELWKEAQTQAQARVKITIMLGQIAEIEKVEVTNEDLAQAATREAMMMRTDPNTYVQELAKDQVRLNRLRQDILHDKTLELMSSKTKEKLAEAEEKTTETKEKPAKTKKKNTK